MEASKSESPLSRFIKMSSSTNSEIVEPLPTSLNQAGHHLLKKSGKK